MYANASRVLLYAKKEMFMHAHASAQLEKLKRLMMRYNWHTSMHMAKHRGLFVQFKIRFCPSVSDSGDQWFRFSVRLHENHLFLKIVQIIVHIEYVKSSR